MTWGREGTLKWGDLHRVDCACLKSALPGEAFVLPISVEGWPAVVELHRPRAKASYRESQSILPAPLWGSRSSTLCSLDKSSSWLLKMALICIIAKLH